LAGLLGGCSSLPTPSFDPTDMLDFLDTKKKAPGERKPVFPEGVPGISQGVPRDMVRGSAEARPSSDAQTAAAAAAAAPPEPPPPAAKRTRSAATRPPAQDAAPQVEIAPDDVNVEESMPANPAPPPRRQARTRTTAPPPDQPQANPFPAPMPSR
jgi:hypothetical protein